MPQGGIDEGETPYEAALRELYEETNVSSVALLRERRTGSPTIFPKLRTTAGAANMSAKSSAGSRCASPATTARSIFMRLAAARIKPEFDAWRWERFRRCRN